MSLSILYYSSPVIVICVIVKIMSYSMYVSDSIYILFIEFC